MIINKIFDCVLNCVLSGVERTGPPDGDQARVVRHGRAGAGRALCGQSDGVKWRESDRFSSDEEGGTCRG